jgi:hypothetical protein
MRGFVCSALTALRSPGTGEKHSTVKRKIALHLGYVGTKYKGMCPSHTAIPPPSSGYIQKQASYLKGVGPKAAKQLVRRMSATTHLKYVLLA